MLIRVDEETKVRTFAGAFPKGSWEVRYVFTSEEGEKNGFIGVPIPFCPDGHETIEFDLVPYPYTAVPRSRGMVDVSAMQEDMFHRCLVGWRGLETEVEEGGEKKVVPFPCDKKHKDFVYKYRRQIRNFVMECIDEMGDQGADAVKN